MAREVRREREEVEEEWRVRHDHTSNRVSYIFLANYIYKINEGIDR